MIYQFEFHVIYLIYFIDLFFDWVLYWKPHPETTEEIEDIVNVDYDIDGEDIEDIYVDYVTLKSGEGVELPGS